MKRVLNSKWKFSGYAFLIAIGGIIGATIVSPGYMYSIYGVLTGSLIIVVINLLYVLYNNKHKENEIRNEKY